MGQQLQNVAAMLATALALLLSGSNDVVPPPPPADAPQITDRETPKDAEEGSSALGVQVDLGVPDGLGVAVMTSPAQWVRIQIAGLTNGGGFGVRVGLVLLPLPSFFKVFRPMLSLEGGTVFSSTASWLPGLDPAAAQTLAKLRYSYASAQVGFEAGSRSVAFILRGGVSYIDAQLPSLDVALQSTSTLTVTNAGLHGLIPSVRLGVMFAFN